MAPVVPAEQGCSPQAGPKSRWALPRQAPSGAGGVDTAGGEASAILGTCTKKVTPRPSSSPYEALTASTSPCQRGDALDVATELALRGREANLRVKLTSGSSAAKHHAPTSEPGTIVFPSTLVGLNAPFQGAADYATGKAELVVLTRALAVSTPSTSSVPTLLSRAGLRWVTQRTTTDALEPTGKACTK